MAAQAVVRRRSAVQAMPAQVNSNTYQGSIVKQAPVPGVLPLSLDLAIRMGLQYNLGLVLSGVNAGSAGAQQLQQLQALLPTVTASAKEADQQTNLQAEGLVIPGFPAVIGPYAYTDIRGSVQWSLLNLSSLDNYLASKHNFQGSRLSIEDAKDMVVLTVGNAYLLCIADASRVQSAQSQVNTSKVSLDQAVANHQAGTSPLLDELRARVDYQTQQQTLITAQNQYEKDKIALARAIGLPLEQSYELSDQAPFKALDNVDTNAAVQQGLAHRHDLQALEQQVESAKASRSAATAERYPTVAFSGDYGVIGPTLGHSHGTFDAAGHGERAALRGGQVARRCPERASATGTEAGTVERPAGADQRRCAQQYPRHSGGRQAGFCSAQQRRIGDRGFERSATAVRGRRGRQSCRIASPDIDGAGRRPAGLQPLPAQRGETVAGPGYGHCANKLQGLRGR